LRLYNRLQILIRDRLDNVPIFIEHLNVAETRMRTLVRVIERILASIFAAIDRLDAFGFENFPSSFFLPSRVPRRPDLNDSRAHRLGVLFDERCDSAASASAVSLFT